MKTEVFKAHWKMYTIYSALMLVFGATIVYYLLFLAPQIRSKSFINKVEDDFVKTAEDVKFLDEIVLDWNNFVQGDLSAKAERLNQAKTNFENLGKDVDSTVSSSETEELRKLLKEYEGKSSLLLSNILTISEYFKKVEKAVASFNGLSVQTENIDQLKKLVLDFKSVSESSLAELEKIEPPAPLLGIDKDYKDLLRQYIQSAGALSDAINSNNTAEIEKVGRQSDEAVMAITRQLGQDLEQFSSTSDMVKDMELIKGFKKSIEQKIADLKKKNNI